MLFMVAMPAPARPKTAADRKQKSIPSCPKCGHKQAIKSGQVQGEQRWKCKACAYQYTRVVPRGRPLWQKSLVVFLYSYGMSMHEIGRIFHVQPSTVLKWVRAYAKDHQPKPESGDITLMELNAMQKHLKNLPSKNAGILCIAIGDATFKKNVGITITKR
jgi:transposase-like protein